MMSKAGEEDEERFHDSLDRLLSSASCSCSPSASEQEDDYDRSSDCSPDYSVLIPRFPRGVSENYDVWKSQPSSVEERRIRLLRRMGLTRDPSLLYHRPVSFPSHRLLRNSVVTFNEDGNSLKSSGISREGFGDGTHGDGRASGMFRSKSNGDCSYGKNPEVSSVESGVLRGENTMGEVTRSHSQDSVSDSPDKPSIVRIRTNINDGGMFGDFLDLDLEEVDAMCMIKNLDNGKKFVVNKVREDGTWEKIKEIGTGRQLTMEEFSSEMCVGTSPIVQELMRRQNFEDRSNEGCVSNANGTFGGVSKMKKSRSWLKSLKNAASSVTGQKERRSSDGRDTSSEKGGRRSSSATDDVDSQEVCFHGPERVRVRQYGKSVKEVSALFKSQEIQAHNGSIWAIKFSLDGKYLASAGEDCVINVWQVLETERKGDFCLDKFEDGNLQVLYLSNGSPEPSTLSPGRCEKKRRERSSITRKSVSLEQILLPETLFSFSEKPMCSLEGHLGDILDLSWSKSQQLLSSSMDKTVRLWDLSSKSCLKIFAHSDYVTCIQFNPVDDRYFISGSLDAKVRIWSIPDRQVVDWNDLHEMVTAACYTPDGQGALVGSYKGSCRLFNTSENKLLQKSQINLQNKKKKSHQKKITGFQFSPGSTSEVLITSADSRVRAIDGVDLVHKFKGFRNANSQISASITSNGKYVISASEDSCVYIWRHDNESQPNRSKVGVTRAYELFHCQDVSVAIPWPGMASDSWGFPNSSPQRRDGGTTGYHHEEPLTAYNRNMPTDESGSPWESGCSNSPLHGALAAASPNRCLFDRISATWPEEKLVVSPALRNRSASHASVDFSNGVYHNRSAWGMVIVTASRRGEIRTFQNFGLPVRI